MLDLKPSDLDPPGPADRTQALLVHLSCWLFPPVPFLAPWLVSAVLAKRGSLFVRYHALQSFYFQVLAFCGLAVAAVIGFVLPCVGLLLKPAAWLLFAVSPLWALVAGLMAARGHWYRYPWAGTWASEKLSVPSILLDAPTPPDTEPRP
ncbi:MAG: DUF4870 domain-containing protein [Planctomycetes bacterium]|nr:DUF4870 domain-containing protein [Planctomycetota bacterium]